MRILFLSDNFPPEVNAPASRTFEHCAAWAKAGDEVTIVTSVPNFPHGIILGGYRNRWRQEERMEGMTVVRVWTYIARNEGFWKRSVDYASFGMSAFFAGLSAGTDVIVATSPQFFTVIAGYLLAKIKEVPWVFELRDLWPASIAAVGAMKNRFLLSCLEKMELFLYRDADLVVALTEAFKRDLVRRGIAADKIRVVPNGSNTDLFRPAPKDAELVKRYGLAGKFVVGYLGTHGMAHKLDFIVRAAAKVLDTRIHFIFIGDGAEKRNVVALARDLKLRNATFLDPVPKEQVAAHWALMDAALVPLRRSDVFLTVLPSKIFEAAAMKKPMLLGVDGEARTLVERFGAGVFFEPENESDFIEKLSLLATDHKRYAACLKGCEALARAYDRRTLAAELRGYLHELVAPS